MKQAIQIINESTCVSDEQLKPIVDALQIQVSRDFAPIWQKDATLSFVPKGGKPDPAQWWMVILNTSDQADALGYHDLTTAALPIGKVFAQSDLESGSSLSVTISHELLEMLGDPEINEVAANSAGTLLFARENCDACEDDSFGYQIEGVLVSDFVTPMWFVDATGQAQGTQYDFQGHCTAPFQVLRGGYISYLDLTRPEKGWQQITMDGKDVASRKPHGSRFERRARLRHHWRKPKVSATAVSE